MERNSIGIGLNLVLIPSHTTQWKVSPEMVWYDWLVGGSDERWEACGDKLAQAWIPSTAT